MKRKAAEMDQQQEERSPEPTKEQKNELPQDPLSFRVAFLISVMAMLYSHPNYTRKPKFTDEVDEAKFDMFKNLQRMYQNDMAQQKKRAGDLPDIRVHHDITQILPDYDEQVFRDIAEAIENEQELPEKYQDNKPVNKLFQKLKHLVDLEIMEAAGLDEDHLATSVIAGNSPGALRVPGDGVLNGTTTSHGINPESVNADILDLSNGNATGRFADFGHVDMPNILFDLNIFERIYDCDYW